MRRILSCCLMATAVLGAGLSLSGCIVAPPRHDHYRHERVWVPGHWAPGHVWVGGHWR
jgi:hypothetical protein